MIQLRVVPDRLSEAFEKVGVAAVRTGGRPFLMALVFCATFVAVCVLAAPVAAAVLAPPPPPPYAVCLPRTYCPGAW